MELNKRQIKDVLYLKEKETITNREFREMAGVTDRTVIRDLNNLCERGMLKKIGKTGRGTAYTLTRQKPDKREQMNERTKEGLIMD